MADSSDERAPLAHLRHDLRTPINQIIGFSELLMEETAEAGHTAYDADLKIIRGAAKTLLDLINVNLTDDRLSLGGAVVSAGPAVAASLGAGGEEAKPALAPGRILVVDDNPGNREMLIRQLERQGHTVAAAENGRVAIDLLRAEAFDLVLLDLMMPVLDGHETLLEMKEDAALRHLPVIMISALDELSSVIRCIELGAEDFLPKPFNPILLRARIGAGLEKKRFRDQERLYVETIETTQKRLAEELEEAGKYVRSILPAPTTGPLAADWRLIPSTELGGDSFGYHWIDPDHFAIYLLDVCGHGVGAALLSVSAINVLRNAALPGIDFRDPGAMMTALNEAFLMEKQNDMYFTIWYGVWEPSTRRLRFAAAGHPPALLASPQADGPNRVEVLKGGGMLLGGMSGAIYKTFERLVPDPAKLYIVSDGTFEITRPDGSMWEPDAFHAFFAAPPPGPSELDGLLEDDFSIMSFQL
jgi:sigma-B regulation protein RsbU (phosphoserine phosphatase)